MGFWKRLAIRIGLEKPSNLTTDERKANMKRLEYINTKLDALYVRKNRMSNKDTHDKIVEEINSLMEERGRLYDKLETCMFPWHLFGNDNNK